MIEILWMLFAGTGLVVAVFGLRDANAGVSAVRNRYNGRRIVARSYRRSEFITVIKQAILLLMGVPAALDPEPVRLSLFVVALFAMNLLGFARTTLEMRDRVILRRTLDRDVPETQNQREDREMGDRRRELPSVRAEAAERAAEKIADAQNGSDA